MKTTSKIVTGIALASMMFGMMGPIAYAKGGGGGRGGGGARSSSSVRSAPRVSTPKVSTPKVVTPKAPRVSTRPSRTTAKVTAATPIKVGKTIFSKKGSVVDANYQPKFRGGYAAPSGSVVYYRDNGIMDWLPFYLILSNQQHRQAVVQEPAKDGQPAKETVVKAEGTDGMYILNWILSIALVLGLIALIVWLVDRRTRNRNW